MQRLPLLPSIASLALFAAACSGGVAGESETPAATGSPVTSPSGSSDGSPDESADASPASPDAGTTPGETRTFPFEPEGAPGLSGHVTVTDLGSGSSRVTVEFDTVDLPATAAVARVLDGSCGEAGQSVGELELTDGRLEGVVPIALDQLLETPHAIAIYESEAEDEPLACADLATA